MGRAQTNDDENIMAGIRALSICKTQDRSCRHEPDSLYRRKHIQAKVIGMPDGYFSVQGLADRRSGRSLLGVA
jgi:hypothetical protein